MNKHRSALHAAAAACVCLFSSVTRGQETTHYEYDGKMQQTLVVVKDVLGAEKAVSHYRYDELGRVTLSARLRSAADKNLQDDLNQQITLYQYDRAGNVAKVVGKAPAVGSPLAIMPGDAVTEYEYDAVNRCVQVNGPTGEVAKTIYDDAGNVVKERVLLADSTYAITSIEYDALNRPTKVTGPEGNYRVQAYDTRSRSYLAHAYASDAQVLEQQRWYYDTAGRVLTTAVMADAEAAYGPEVNPAVDRVAMMQYDPDGHVVLSSTFNRDSPVPNITSFAYDAFGRLTRTTDPMGHWTRTDYGATGLVEQTVVNDGIGELVTTYEYDGLDRQIKKRLLANNGAPERMTETIYDDLDRPSLWYDEERRLSGYLYDTLGQQVLAVADFQGLGRETHSQYDRLGRLVRQYVQSEDNAVVYEYDLAGRLTREIAPIENDAFVTEYDAAGRITRTIDGRGQIIEREYDQRGLLTDRTYDDGSDRFEFDGLGRLTLARRVTTEYGEFLARSSYTYDDLSNVLSDTQHLFNQQGPTRTLSFEHDQAGNRKAIKFDENGDDYVLLTYTRDSLARVTDVFAKFRTARWTPGAYHNLIHYDYNGLHLLRRRLETLYQTEAAAPVDALYLDYAVQRDGHRFVSRITNRTVFGPAELDELARFDFDYSLAGDRTQRIGNRGDDANAAGFAAIDRQPEMDHDVFHRLTEVRHDQGDAPAAAEVIVYDLRGNRQSYADARDPARDQTYDTNDANQYTAINAQSVTHDLAGNLTEASYLHTSGNTYGLVYSYDHDNRLVKVEDVSDTGNEVVVLGAYDYDALGRLIRAEQRFDRDGTPVNAVQATHHYFYDGANIIAEYDDAHVLARRYVHGTQYVDERAVMIVGPAAEATTGYYVLRDMDTVVGMTAVNGTLMEGYQYDAYGEVELFEYGPFDFDRSGHLNDSDAATFHALVGHPTSDPMGDADFDGDVDGDDETAFNARYAVFTDPSGNARIVSGVDNPYFFTGRRLFFYEDQPCDGFCPPARYENNQLQHSRARFFDPVHGRFLSRDPLGPVDGPNLYEYAQSNPGKYADPSGTDKEWVEDAYGFLSYNNADFSWSFGRKIGKGMVLIEHQNWPWALIMTEKHAKRAVDPIFGTNNFTSTTEIMMHFTGMMFKGGTKKGIVGVLDKRNPREWLTPEELDIEDPLLGRAYQAIQERDTATIGDITAASYLLVYGGMTVPAGNGALVADVFAAGLELTSGNVAGRDAIVGGAIVAAGVVTHLHFANRGRRIVARTAYDPVTPQHCMTTVYGRRLYSEATAYRAKLVSNGASMQYRNIVVAEVMVDGEKQLVRFLNKPKAMHSEERLLTWYKKLQDQDRNVRVLRVFSDRRPCGTEWANCAGKLGEVFGQDLEVYFEMTRGVK